MIFLRSGLFIILVAFIASCGGGSGGSFKGSIFSADGGAAAGQYSGPIDGELVSDFSPAAVEEGGVFIVVTDSGEFSAVADGEFEELDLFAGTLQLVGSVSVDDLSLLGDLIDTSSNDEEAAILQACDNGGFGEAAWVEGFADVYFDGVPGEIDGELLEGLPVLGAVCADTDEEGNIIRKALVFSVSTDEGNTIFEIEADYIPLPDEPPLGTEVLEGLWTDGLFGGGDFTANAAAAEPAFGPSRGRVGVGRLCISNSSQEGSCEIGVGLTAAVVSEIDLEADIEGFIDFEVAGADEFDFAFYNCNIDGTITTDGDREYLASGTLECFVFDVVDTRQLLVEPAIQREPDAIVDFNGILAAREDPFPCEICDVGVDELNGLAVNGLFFTIEIPDLEFAGYAELERGGFIDEPR